MEPPANPGRFTAPVPAVPGIDLSFQPTTYFGPLPLETHLLAHVTGHERREFLRTMLASGDKDMISELRASSLDDDTREAVGRIHPALMGGEYLPPLLHNETEIARISLASVTADQISVRARRLKHRIAYRIVDEYSENGIQYRCHPARSTRPLTVAALVGMIDQASDDGGPVFSPLRLNIDGGGDNESLRGFVTVSSEFYPQLGAYYAARIEAWFEAKVPQEAEAED